MKVLLTGATGLVGANVARHLVAAGYAVRAAVRPTSNRLGLAGLDLEEVDLRLGDPRSSRDAVAGCDAVIHAAAAVWVGRTGRAELTAANVVGTDALCAAAGEAGIGRFVHVSSVDALGIRTWEQPADEDTPPNLGWLDCAYVDTKLEAERVVRRHVAAGLPAVIVNPAFMLGPWDTRPTSGTLLLEVAAGKALLAPTGGNCFVDVRDVAVGIRAALERGRVGRSYVLGGDNLTYFDAWTRIARLTGGRAPRGRAPRAVTRLAGRAGALWGRLSGKEPAINPVTAAMGELPHYFDSSRARRELAFPETDLDRAVADAWTWFRAHGYA